MATVAKVSTITARSEKSFEDAVASGLARANKTLRGITGAWVKSQKVEVEGGAITTWQVTMEVTFILEG